MTRIREEEEVDQLTLTAMLSYALLHSNPLKKTFAIILTLFSSQPSQTAGLPSVVA